MQSREMANILGLPGVKMERIWASNDFIELVNYATWSLQSQIVLFELHIS